MLRVIACVSFAIFGCAGRETGPTVEAPESVLARLHVSFDGEHVNDYVVDRVGAIRSNGRATVAHYVARGARAEVSGTDGLRWLELAEDGAVHVRGHLIGRLGTGMVTEDSLVLMLERMGYIYAAPGGEAFAFNGSCGTPSPLGVSIDPGPAVSARDALLLSVALVYGVSRDEHDRTAQPIVRGIARGESESAAPVLAH